MYAQGLKHFPHIEIAVAAMLLFFLSFAAILFITYNTRRNHDAAARLPFADEEDNHAGN